jgi:hypothetical protein
MKMIFSINKPNTNLPKKQNMIKPLITEKESVVPESFNFFQKIPMFQQILLPYNCGNCGK